ncbi:HAMP domain-containing histidine kinase [Sulfurimonas sp. MAG313]|nr:HAMP domain-containing sensor histidine kinase [Sulfurimonas sp. MAG313]MDF1880770.1 HAMP domain-containing histidine kinase [Sulfurimonas sp. MAG313]
MKFKSMKSNIIVFFLISSLLAMSLSLAYTSYSYFNHLNSSHDEIILSPELEHERISNQVLEFTLKSLALYLIVFIVFFSFFTLYVKAQFKSLHCLVDFCSSYKEDKTALPACDGTYEVKNLRDSILTLIDANDYLCDQKQELFKEAAHELKSPIAVLKARISLFEKDSSIPKKDFVNEAQEDISNITSKLKELIFLKSIEWDMQLPQERVNMEDNCKMMQDAFEPILRKKSVQVDSNWEENFILYTYKDAMRKVLQAVFENIFIHTKANSTILVEAKPNEIFIKNAIGEADDIPLFSSYIGMKMIKRLAPKLAYEYKTHNDDKYFYTHLIFHQRPLDGCAI